MRLALAALLVLACSKPDATPRAAATASAPAPAPTKDAPPAPAPAPREEGPDVVAKRYLELGAAGDLSKIKDLVEARCAATKVGDVDAVKLMGARMTLTGVETSVEGTPGARSRVKYTVKGDVEAKSGQTETDIFGKKVAVKVGAMSMKGVTQSGALDLVKVEGRWVVTCP